MPGWLLVPRRFRGRSALCFEKRLVGLLEPNKRRWVAPGVRMADFGEFAIAATDFVGSRVGRDAKDRMRGHQRESSSPKPSMRKELGRKDWTRRPSRL